MPKKWQWVNWVGNIVITIAAVSMLSVHAASVSVTPWVLFAIGNIIWMTDSLLLKNWPWVFLAMFFTIWDALVVYSRTTESAVFSILAPLLTLLEMLP